ncbi:UNVERIFIED_CONTAM: hypothetical protein FKN15_055632 [Acipenser sinensis]
MVMTTLSLLGVPLSSLSLSFFSLSFLSRLDSFFLGSAVAVVWGWSAWAESSSLLSLVRSDDDVNNSQRDGGRSECRASRRSRGEAQFITMAFLISTSASANRQPAASSLSLAWYESTDSPALCFSRPNRSGSEASASFCLAAKCWVSPDTAVE